MNAPCYPQAFYLTLAWTLFVVSFLDLIAIVFLYVHALRMGDPPRTPFDTASKKLLDRIVQVLQRMSA